MRYCVVMDWVGLEIFMFVLQVWMDIDQMAGSTLQSMADAVENADIFLMAMSHKYKDSPNCRAGKFGIILLFKTSPESLWLGWRLIDCMVFNAVFQLCHGNQHTYPCFPGVLVTITPHTFCPINWLLSHIIIVETMDSGGREMNSVAMTIINPQKEYWPSQGLNQQPPVLKSCMLPTELWGLGDSGRWVWNTLIEDEQIQHFLLFLPFF